MMLKKVGEGITQSLMFLIAPSTYFLNEVPKQPKRNNPKRRDENELKPLAPTLDGDDSTLQDLKLMKQQLQLSISTPQS